MCEAFTLATPLSATRGTNGCQFFSKHVCSFRHRTKPVPTHGISMLREEVSASRGAYVERVSGEVSLESAYRIWNRCLEESELGRIQPAEDDLDATTETVLARDSFTGRVIGAARLIRERQNVRIERVSVLQRARGKGIGRMLVEKLLTLAAPVDGAVYTKANAWEMGFYSILGFESQGNDVFEGGTMRRTMVYRFPVCSPAVGCVGLHHTSIRVSDIERSLAFYGCLGFFVTEKFLTPAGARACFVEGLGMRLVVSRCTVLFCAYLSCQRYVSIV